jgi:hypothetical protein
MRCLYGTYCRSEGEVCGTDEECCQGPCVADSSGAKLCRSSGICNVVGEACTGPSQCCSNACADIGNGFKICQYIGGCRPDKERCDKNTDCCTGTCEADPAGGVKRCQRTNDCGGVGGGAGPGEICDPQFHQCCPNPGEGAQYCRETVFGVRRCGGPITRPDGGGGPDGGGTLPDGGICIPDAQDCRFGDQCCGGKCIQQPDGSFKCQTICVPDGGTCTTNTDCCNLSCDPLTLKCGPGGTPCKPIGTDCTTNADCCNKLCTNGKCYVIVK